MCFYEQYKYACGDWKWGNFRQHCNREYRTGETCGMKLLYGTIGLTGKCPQCEKIEKKLRRLAKAEADYRRWAQDPSRIHSMQKAMEDISTFKAEITLLQADKDRRYANIGNSRRQQMYA